MPKMMRHMGPSEVTERPNLSEIEGNPAFTIRKEYPVLMACESAEDLSEYATSIMLSHVGPGKGASNATAIKFLGIVDSIMKEPERKRLARLKAYLTNFLLAADNQSVIKTGR